MLLRLIILLTVVPVIEITLILRVHDWVAAQYGSGMGMLISVGTIVITGIVGANLAKSQGLGVLKKIQEASAQGQVPAGAMIDGLMVLIGGALLLTPGYLTDAFGFSLLFPLTRGLYKGFFTEMIARKIKNGSLKTNFQGAGFSANFQSGSQSSQFSNQFGGVNPGTGFASAASSQPTSRVKSSSHSEDDIIDVEAEDLDLKN